MFDPCKSVNFSNDDSISQQTELSTIRKSVQTMMTNDNRELTTTWVQHWTSSLSSVGSKVNQHFTRSSIAGLQSSQQTYIYTPWHAQWNWHWVREWTPFVRRHCTLSPLANSKNVTSQPSAIMKSQMTKNHPELFFNRSELFRAHHAHTLSKNSHAKVA